jgi:hypothetical protein
VTTSDGALERALGDLVPSPNARPNWEDALRRARRASRARRLPVLAFVAALAAGLFALAAIDPFDRGGGPSVLARALAAVGDGPVLHIVSREPSMHDALIDRRSGREQADPKTEIEIWYEPGRGIHYVSRVGPAVLHDDVVSETRSISELDTLRALATDYRGALESGRAALAGEGELDGARVYWIRTDDRVTQTRRTPSGPSETVRIDEQVAVEADRYRPVATRYVQDGETVPHSLRRIVTFETLPEGAGGLDQASAPPPSIGILCCSSARSTLAGAAEILGRRPLWLGKSFAGLPLARVSRVEAKTKPGNGDHFTGTQSSVELFYGTLDEAGEPDTQKPNLRVTEGTPLVTFLARMAIPPAGWALVQAETATTTQDGIQVEIRGTGAPVRAALEQLTEVPAG